VRPRAPSKASATASRPSSRMSNYSHLI
jgi:hypothetical protein